MDATTLAAIIAGILTLIVVPGFAWWAVRTVNRLDKMDDEIVSLKIELQHAATWVKMDEKFDALGRKVDNLTNQVVRELATRSKTSQ